MQSIQIGSTLEVYTVQIAGNFKVTKNLILAKYLHKARPIVPIPSTHEMSNFH